MTTDITVAPPARPPFVAWIVQATTDALVRTHAALRNRSVQAFIAYALIALVANLPSWPGDPSRVATCACGGFEDPNQTAWFLAWVPYAILHGHNPFVTNFINYPAGVNLAQNTEMPLLGVLTAPLTLLVNPIASMNLLRWLAFALSAFSAFFVLRRFVRFVPAAFLGGLLYGFSPYMVTQGSVHLDLAFAPLPPLILYGAFELIVRQSGRPIYWGVLTATCAVAQFYISAEVLATTAVVASIALFFIFFLCVKEVPRHFTYAITGLATAGVITAVCIAYPLWLMSHGIAHYTGPAQGYHEVYNADLLGAFVPTTAQLFAPHHLASIGTNLVGGRANIDENGSYIGIPLIAVGCYFVLRYWRRLWMAFLALMTATVFALSLGPFLHVNGKYYKLPFNLPFRKINHLPLINNILPVRFSLYVMLFVAIIIALGIDYFHDDVVARRQQMQLDGTVRLPARVVVSRIVGGVVILAAIIAVVPNWPYTSRRPQTYYAETAAGLSVIPTGSVVIAYPYPTPYSDDAMLWQALAGMRFQILGSYALVPGRTHSATTFPAVLQPKSVEAMLANSITAVPDPALPAIAATAHTIHATVVHVLPASQKATRYRHGGMGGVIANVAYREHDFVVNVRPAVPVNVTVTSSTRYINARGRQISWRQLIGGDDVIIEGAVVPGTVNAHMVQALRQFVVDNHVTAIDVELGRRDSAEITTWMKLAFGNATRAGGGGEFWIRPR